MRSSGALRQQTGRHRLGTVPRGASFFPFFFFLKRERERVKESQSVERCDTTVPLDPSRAGQQRPEETSSG